MRGSGNSVVGRVVIAVVWVVMEPVIPKDLQVVRVVMLRTTYHVLRLSMRLVRIIMITIHKTCFLLSILSKSIEGFVSPCLLVSL